MKLTGAQIIVECLKEQGVDTVFGYPGGNVLNIYDELYKSSDKINHILTAHEQGASHAADGYARATGKVGVCITTSGPGATNAVTGIATAFMDSSPVVFIMGNVPTHMLGKDSFQEAAITEIASSVTKYTYIVDKVEDLANAVREAFIIATSGRPGPVLIDVPKDVTAQLAEFVPNEPYECQKHKLFSQDVDYSNIDSVAAAINESQRPFMFLGGGAANSEASGQLIELAQKIGAPVACSLMGQGAFPANHLQYTGMMGMHGSKASNDASRECDLMIAVGTRFSDRVFSQKSSFASNAKVVHIDIDAAEINKNIDTYMSIIGDAKEIVTKLNQKIETKPRKEWLEKILAVKAKHPVVGPSDGKLTSYTALMAIKEITKGDAIIATDVGQHQMWTSQYYGFNEPRRFITSGGFGTMGFGMGAAMGAKLGVSGKRAVLITGDGSFRMNCNELSALSHYNIPITIVILNNKVLGMVRQWQKIFYDERYSHTNLDRAPDFVKLADAYGFCGYDIDTLEDFCEKFAAAYNGDKTVVLNCSIDSNERVLPMVASGQSLDNMILY